MLDSVDLSAKLAASAYKAQMPDLEIRLGALQRAAIEARIPVVIAFEGWEAAGKGTQINRLIHALDPRHFQVHPIDHPSDDERYRPPLWRFWTKLPARGRMSIFDRSWCDRVLSGRADKSMDKDAAAAALDEIVAFERQLTTGGTVIIKIFLHISKKTQKKRFEKLEDNPATAWRIDKADWAHHRHYDRYAKVAGEVLEKTAPWHVVAAEDPRHATVAVFDIVCAALADALDPKRAAAAPAPAAAKKVDTDVLSKVTMQPAISREDYGKQLDRYQRRVRDLQHEIYTRRIPVIIAYEGWDAAGKGGNIKRLTQSMDPRGYDVVPIAAPNDIEKAHHYLWRFWKAVPKGGHVAIFDRTWYGRVLVERVEKLTPEPVWRRAYGEINEMEQQWVAFGAVLVKFWLHIDREEQLRRFEERQAVAYKNWKITEEDWRNREKWDAYLAAVNEMLARTSTPHAPWTVIASDSKLFARLEALRTVIAAIEARL